MNETLVLVLEGDGAWRYASTYIEHLPMALELLHQAGGLAEQGQPPQSMAECLRQFTTPAAPLVAPPNKPLLQELDTAAFDLRLAQFDQEPAVAGSYYVFDFNNDRLSATDWTEDGPDEYTCPLSQARVFYSRARQQLPDNRYKLDNDYLSLSLGLLGDVSTPQAGAPAADEQPGAASAGPEMKM